MIRDLIELEQTLGLPVAVCACGYLAYQVRALRRSLGTLRGRVRAGEEPVRRRPTVRDLQAMQDHDRASGVRA